METEQQPSPYSEELIPTPIATENSNIAAVPEIQYVSNPLKLFGPSIKSIRINIGSWVKLGFALAGAFMIVLIPIITLAVLGAFHKSKNLDSVLLNTSPMISFFIIASVILLVLVVSALLIWRLGAASVLLLLAGAHQDRLSFGEAFKGSRRFYFRYTFATFCYGLISALLAIFFLVPGLLFYTWWAFAVLIIAEENLRIGAAFERSKKLVQGRFWEVLSILSIGLITNVNISNRQVSMPPALILFGLVMEVLGIFYMAALPIRFVMLKAYKDSSRELPPVSKINYVIPFMCAAAFITLSIYVSHLPVKKLPSKHVPSVAESKEVVFNNAYDAATAADEKKDPKEFLRQSAIMLGAAGNVRETAQANRFYGLAEGRLGDYAAAEKYEIAAIVADPTYALPHELLAEIYEHNEKYPQALSEADKAIVLDPKNVDSYLVKAAILNETKQSKQAIQLLEKTLTLFPNDTFVASNLKLYKSGGSLDHYNLSY